MALLVANVTVEEDVEERILIAGHLGVALPRVVRVQLVRRSLDARQRSPRWVGVFRVDVTDEAEVLSRSVSGVRSWRIRDDGRYGLEADTPPRRVFRPEVRPIVVGAGPAGLFAALYLAESGAPVRLFERGSPVEDRIGEVNDFWRRRTTLDPESNLVFGEGGAGTFSDGKIYTRRRDGEVGYIFRRLIDAGADPAVIQQAWAHLGTDRIRALLPPLRQRLLDLGVEVRFGARVDDVLVDDGRCVGVRLADGTEVSGGPVLVAPGHSARDTLEMMVRAGAAAEPRGIAVGVRVEHPQAMVDRARYGGRPDPTLPPATYRLAHNPTKGPASRTFCMCPGGMVVPASNHEGRVVVNGMSFAARRAFWANAAVIVEIPPTTFGDPSDPLAGFAWQDAIEARAFEAAGADHRAPAQGVQDFLARRAPREVPRSSYPMGITPVDLREVLPADVVASLADALVAFDKTIPGFASDRGVLIAPETRTTSPVRFLRDERGCSTTIEGLFPIGEGAGHAGGIISSALDGLRSARCIAAEGVA